MYVHVRAYIYIYTHKNMYIYICTCTCISFLGNLPQKRVLGSLGRERLRTQNPRPPRNRQTLASPDTLGCFFRISMFQMSEAILLELRPSTQGLWPTVLRNLLGFAGMSRRTNRGISEVGLFMHVLIHRHIALVVPYPLEFRAAKDHINTTILQQKFWYPFYAGP